MTSPHPDSWRRWWPVPWLLVAVLILAGRFGNSLQAEVFGHSLWGWLLRAPSHTDLSFRILLPFAWWVMVRHQRQHVRAMPAATAWGWFPLVLASLAAFALAYRVQCPRLGYIALLSLAWSGLAVFRGVAVARAFLLPTVYLLLALPDLLHGLAMSMRLVSADAVSRLLMALDYPWELHGTLFLRVAEPLSKVGVDDVCSGISSLAALLGIMTPYAVLALDRDAARWTLVALCLPAALLVNILRVASVLLLVEWRGDAVARAYHDSFIAGALPYTLGVSLLIVGAQLLQWRLRPVPAMSAGPGAAHTAERGRLAPWVALAGAVSCAVALLAGITPARLQQVPVLQLPGQAGPWTRVPHRWCTNTACGKAWVAADVSEFCPSCHGSLQDRAGGELKRQAYYEAYTTAWYMKPGEDGFYVHALVAKPEEQYKGWPPRLLLDLNGALNRYHRLAVPAGTGSRIRAMQVDVRFADENGPPGADGVSDASAVYWFAAESWAEAAPWRRDLRIWAAGVREGILPRPVTYLAITRRKVKTQDERDERNRIAHFVAEFNRALELQRLDAVDRGR